MDREVCTRPPLRTQTPTCRTLLRLASHPPLDGLDHHMPTKRGETEPLLIERGWKGGDEQPIFALERENHEIEVSSHSWFRSTVPGQAVDVCDQGFSAGDQCKSLAAERGCSRSQSRPRRRLSWLKLQNGNSPCNATRGHTIIKSERRVTTEIQL